MGSIRNSKGSTFKDMKGGGNYISVPFQSADGTMDVKLREGVWLPSGTGEANLGNSGAVSSSRSAGVNVQAGSTSTPSRSNSVSFNTKKRKALKINGAKNSSTGTNIT